MEGLERRRALVVTEIIFIPIRRHSPTCALQVRRLLNESRPAEVLIEGPSDFNPHFERLHEEHVVPPVAFFSYVTFCGEVPVPANQTPQTQARRFHDWYPLCDYSPAWVAIKTATHLGIPARFIDLSLKARIHADDDDEARRQFMATQILHAKKRHNQEDVVIVVCSALHVDAIERLLHTPTESVGQDKRPGDTGVFLVPYDFARMPDHHYAAWNQRLWEDLDGQFDPTEPKTPFWMDLLAQASREARKDDAPVSTADLEAASEMALRLASFRGRVRPSLVDILDAVQTCWIKGPLDRAHARVLTVVKDVFRGDRIGEVGRSAIDPPLVQDVDARIEAASIDSTGTKRDIRVRPTRGTRDLERMRLLLRLKYLGVDYGRQLRGPRYLKGEDLDRIEQLWSVGWTEQSRLKLLERAAYGPTLEDAVVARLKECVARTTADAGSGAGDVVKHLVDSCALGLHRVADQLIRQLSDVIATDGRLLSVLEALHGLTKLYRYRIVLGAIGLPAVAKAIDLCWRRALWLLTSLSNLPEDQEEQAIVGLRDLEHIALTIKDGVDPDDFFEALQRVQASMRHLPGLRGTVAGLRWRNAGYDTKDLCLQARATFQEASLHPDAPGRFVGGLMAVAPSAVLDNVQLLSGLSSSLSALNETDFRTSLPRLRRAMANLTRAETGRLTRRVTEIWGTRTPGQRDALDLPTDTLKTLHALDVQVRHELANWGITDSPNAGASTERESGKSTISDPVYKVADDQPGSEILRRWRLILGRYSDSSDMPELTDDDVLLDDVVGFLYDREYDEDGRDQWNDDLSSDQNSSTLTVPAWINHLRELFPQETCRQLETEALSRYGMTELVTRPEALERCEASPALLESILILKDHMDPAVLAIARRFIAKIADQMRLPLNDELQVSLSGSRRGRPSRRGRAADFDAQTTIRRNLRHWNVDREMLVIEQPWFTTRRRPDDWRVVICVDQSGSMFSSAIHAAITAGVFFSIPNIHAHLVVFDTRVVDLSARLDDPVETLLSMNLGGGTDIALAVEHCTELVTQPRKTIVVLITDLFEGGDPSLLLARMQRLIDSEVKVLVLGALNERAEGSFDRDMARQLSDLGAEVGAMAPRDLVNWIGEVLR